MKKTLIILIVFAASCQTNLHKSKLIYDEYIESYYKAYNKTRYEERIHEPFRKIGDTVKFYTKYHLAPLKDSFYIEECIDIPANSELILYKIENNLYYFKFLNDTAKKGNLTKMELEFKLSDSMAQKKWVFYEKQKDNIRLYIDSILIKYELSEDEFMEIMAKENYRRTGEQFFRLEL